MKSEEISESKIGPPALEPIRSVHSPPWPAKDPLLLCRKKGPSTVFLLWATWSDAEQPSFDDVANALLCLREIPFNVYFHRVDST
jgi:hypothetical protein